MSESVAEGNLAAVRIGWRDWILCTVIGGIAFFVIEVFNTFDAIVKAVELFRQFRRESSGSSVPAGPFVWRAAKFVIFYLAGGAAFGLALGALSWLFARPSGDAADQVEAAGSVRKRFWWIFAALFIAIIAYIHVRMLVLHPALFKNSYRWAWFAGDPFWTLATKIVGRVFPIVVALILVRKYWNEINTALRRASVPLAIGLALIAVVAAGWWGVRRLAAKPPANTGPNVILLVLDSLRPDHLSWKGLRKPYRLPTTPNIDRLLDDCVWFDQAYVPLARTYPSWLSILTGCWPPTHGVRCDLPPRGRELPRVPTMAQTLQRAGYRTAFFLDNTNFAWMEKDVGFDELTQPPHNAVDFYLSSLQPPSILYYYFLNTRLGYLYEPGLRINAAYRSIYRPEFMNAEIARSLGQMRSEPKFFQAIHLCSIHVPFCVSYPYSTYFAPSFGPVLNRFGYAPLLEQIVTKKRTKQQFSEQETAWVFTQEMNLYDALVRSVDDNAGAVLDAIRNAGLYDNSYIVVMADHGENLPEPGLRYRYGSSTHGFFVWGDGDTRITLAVKFPKQQYARQRVERLVRSIDIAPTLLDSLGLPPLEKAEGVSRMPEIKGRTEERENWIYAETGLSAPTFFLRGHLDYAFDAYPEVHEVDSSTLRIYKKLRYEPNLIAAKDRMIRTERWKLISYPMVNDTLWFKSELFDMTADPNCCHDVSTSHPEVARELRDRLTPFIERDLKEWGTGPLIRREEPGSWLKE